LAALFNMAPRVRRPFAKLRAAGALAVLLAACAPVPTPVVAPQPPVPSGQSAALAAHYTNVQQSLLAQGLLRTDGGGMDFPLTPAMLSRNFLRIAFYEEYSPSGAQIATPIRLTRWAQPVRVKLHFGADMPADRTAADRARIGSYLARLSQLTGLPISLVQSDPNFTIAITNADDRRSLGPLVQTALPQITPRQVASVTNLDRNTYCLVWTQSNAQTHVYERAFVYIPSEHPDLMRLACIHEELAQALGLPNDVGTARPSIFNDDEEFALLTRQDEAMLRMLYNPALKLGMTEAEARPIVERLAADILGGNT
jgi:hypothetical protein